MIKEENELSIIIPTLNCFFYTKQLVESLFAGVGKKLILIDNGSKDETRKYFETRKLIYNDRVILNDMNIGVAGSWNLGIRTAIRDYDSRYFCLLNNDILLHPKAIQCMLEHLKSGKYALISGTDVCGQLNYAHQIFKKILPDKEIINEAPEFLFLCFQEKQLIFWKWKKVSTNRTPDFLTSIFIRRILKIMIIITD